MRIKICGLTRPEDVYAVNSARPEWAGFIIDVPTSRRSLSIDDAAALASALDGDIAGVGVFVDAPVEKVVEAAQACGFKCVQLHGSEDDAYIDRLRASLAHTDIKCDIWQAVKVKGEEDVLRASSSHADLVLLDGGAGEGRRFAWDLTCGMTRPFMLAGGLCPETIGDAAGFGPYGVDLSSGVETEGRKDAGKIAQAVKAAHDIEETYKSI